MSSLTDLTGRDYLSFSSLSSYADCGERFYWERVKSVRTEKGWWLPAGTAFHLATEWLDEGRALTPNKAWHEAWTQTMAKEEETPTKTGGRATKQWPNKETPDYYHFHAPVWLENYCKWRDDRLFEGWNWVSINDKPAIEVPVSGELGGVNVKGYIDRIMASPEGEAHVIDIKTSSRTPTSVQLDVYAQLIGDNYGIPVTYGSYYMARKGEVSEPKPMDMSTAALSNQFTMAKRGIEAEVFLPNVGMLCGTCGVRSHCSVFNRSE